MLRRFDSSARTPRVTMTPTDPSHQTVLTSHRTPSGAGVRKWRTASWAAAGVPLMSQQHRRPAPRRRP